MVEVSLDVLSFVGFITLFTTWRLTRKETPRAPLLPTCIGWPKIVKRKEFVVATRIHNMNSSKLSDPKDVSAFISSALEYATIVIICIGYYEPNSVNHSGLQSYLEVLSQQLEISLGASTMSKVILLPVFPWGKFTSALNAAILTAIDCGYQYIAFQSIEFRLQKGSACKMFERIFSDPEALVIGPEMDGHQFEYGRQILRGRTSPWNTFAIWSIEILALTGFPMIGDAYGGPCGGVEEVSTIALAQYIRPYLKAYLVRSSGILWDTKFVDAKRIAWHDVKMRSKDDRPAAQLVALNLPPAFVDHIDID